MGEKIVDGAVVTASGQSAAFAAARASVDPSWLRDGEEELHRVLEDFDEIAVLVDVSAVSGTTPTLDITVQWSPDDTEWFDTGDAFTQFTAAGKQVLRVPNKAQSARLNYTVGGTTPSFTVNAWVERFR